jgi:hypothetical protein
MIRVTLWFNEEYLPNESEKQKSLTLVLPSIGLWYLSVPTHVGFRKQRSPSLYDPHHSNIATFVILGFGLEYNENWDG